jgi:hypothetical protein
MAITLTSERVRELRLDALKNDSGGIKRRKRDEDGHVK